MIFSKMNLGALAFAGFLALGATSAMACEWGNACGGTGGWVSGGGYTEGGGTGSAWGENYGTGNVVERGSTALSESGFTGTFRFAVDECGDCEADSNAVSGMGFSNNFAGSMLTTDGGSAGAYSEAGGGAGGEGFAWSMRGAPAQ